MLLAPTSYVDPSMRVERVVNFVKHSDTSVWIPQYMVWHFDQDKISEIAL
jgi:hypothetical protein